jgi:hypothetical protein
MKMKRPIYFKIPLKRYAILKNIIFDLFLALQNLIIIRYLPSPNRRGIFFGDFIKFASIIDSDNFDIKFIIPILNKINKNEFDKIILNTIYNFITESIFFLRQISYSHQIPISFNTGSFVNTSENRKYFNNMLKEEFDLSLYINISDFFDIFFDEVANLTSITDIIFKKYKGGKDPLYNKKEDSWRN